MNGSKPLRFAWDGPLPEVLNEDSTWVMAARGDPLDRAALAEREGAQGLAQRIQQGGRAGAVALRSLRFAPDVSAAKGFTCRLLRRVQLEQREAYLIALHGILSSESSVGELLKPYRALCAGALKEVMNDPGAEGNERDWAASALQQVQWVTP